jgi:triacylglycerol lipase
MHGFNASTTNEWSFNGVPGALANDGHTVYETTVPPFDSPSVRAQALAGQIDSILNDTQAGKVNLIAHSMGGLDARELLSVLGYGDRVASLTTISTPHRGSLVADVGLRFLPGDADGALNALASCYGSTFSSAADDSHLRDALTALAESSADAFNAAHPDVAGVYYQSWAGVSSVLGIGNPQDDIACEGLWFGGAQPARSDVMSGQLVPNAAFVGHGDALYPNDGMAMVESAKWGNFRGCIPADHLHEVGQVNKAGVDRRTGFDPVRFYRDVAFELASLGY